jgi:hypothetical protein
MLPTLRHHQQKGSSRLVLPTRAELVLVPRLLTGRKIDKGGLAFSALTTLVSARNTLVHTKSSRAMIEDPVAFEKQKEANDTKYRKLHDDTHTAMKAVILLSCQSRTLLSAFR